MKSCTTTLLIFLLFAAPAQGSVRSDLFAQVKRELEGNGSSCQLMTAEYQALFASAAEWLEDGPSCEKGVKVMAELRRSNSGKHFPRQARRQLSAIRRSRIISRSGQEAAVKVRFPGTPPGWTFRPRSKSSEIYRLERQDGSWKTGSVEVEVRPPIARPTR